MVVEDMKILIVGDSFAVDMTRYVDIPYPGWPNLIANKHSTVNYAEAGASQYRVLKQLQKAKLNEFDFVIVSLSSPNRVYCTTHPIHKTGMHKNSDLIYNDINRFSFFNTKLKTIKNWFKYYFDKDYHDFVYGMITEKIIETLDNKKYILLGHNHTRLHVKNKNLIEFSHIWKTARGKVNHYNQKANKEIFDTIDRIL
jgi:hypothetical protein